MAITVSPEPPVSESSIRTMIGRGAGDKRNVEEAAKVSVLLRVPAALLAAVDEAVGQDQIPTITRHMWILMAMNEKLQRSL